MCLLTRPNIYKLEKTTKKAWLSWISLNKKSVINRSRFFTMNKERVAENLLVTISTFFRQDHIPSSKLHLILLSGWKCRHQPSTWLTSQAAKASVEPTRWVFKRRRVKISIRVCLPYQMLLEVWVIRPAISISEIQNSPVSYSHVWLTIQKV